jgi:LmbE family N-acetylglucosaminyl deacetylase
MEPTYDFFPAQRFVTPAPVPYIATEKELPRQHRVLVFLPHSDDGRYCGATLHLLNPANTITIVVVSPGYQGVDQDLPLEAKSQLRWNETRRWAEILGFSESQLINFRADQTYASQQIDPGEHDRLQQLVLAERPTLVFVPPLSDTAQAINYNTRAMVFQSLRVRVEHEFRAGPTSYRPVIVVEYPTNHVPILPPSDKNFVLFCTDPCVTELRRRANLEHQSQSPAHFHLNERLVEAIHAIAEADTLRYLQKRRHVAERVVGVNIDPRTSRGEHFGVTRLCVTGDPPAIVEERMVFPLSDADRALWDRDVPIP